MICNKMTAEERVTKNLTTLTCLFPELANSTTASIFMRGWARGLITADEFNEAKQYYGALWSYSGD